MKHQPMKQGQTTTPETTYPTLFDKCVCSLTSPANHLTLKMHEIGPMVYSPYPRRLKSLTIFRYNYKGSAFSSVILRPQVLVRSGARTPDLPHSRLALYFLSFTLSFDWFAVLSVSFVNGQSGYFGSGFMTLGGQSKLLLTNTKII